MINSKLKVQSSKLTGFTLVEVMVAMALLMTLTISLVAVGQLSVKSSQIAKVRVRAGLWARQTMEEVLAVRANNFANLAEGTYNPEVAAGKWTLTAGPEVVDDLTRKVEVSRVQRAVACGGERVCPIVTSGGVVDPVTFRAKVTVNWTESSEVNKTDLESLLTFWR